MANFYYNATKPITSQKVPPIVGQLVYNIFLFAGIAVIIAFIIMLVNTIKCSMAPPNSYEHFVTTEGDGRLSAIKQRIRDLRSATTLVQDTLDTMNDAADETCNIMKEVEQVYIGNSSAPTDESEFDLPAAQQKERRAERERRAKLRFAEERKVYSIMNKKPILECFSASEQDIKDAEDELSQIVNEATSVLDNAEVKMAAQKKEKIRSLLNFNARYLKKAINTATAEGFWAELRGTALLAKADELLGKAKSTYNDIQALKKDVKLQRQAANELTKKASNLGDGKYEASDVAAGMAVVTR